MATKKQEKQSIAGQIFGSLISNDKAIESSKAHPWWVAIIISIFGIIIGLLPSFISGASTKGSDAFRSLTYNFDDQITEFANDSSIKGNLPISNHLLSYSGNKTGLTTKVKTIQKEFSDSSSTYNEYTFVAYFINGKVTEQFDEAVNNEAIGIANTYYERKTTTEVSKNDIDQTKEYYCPNLLLLFTDGFIVTTYKSQTTTVAVSYGGYDWSRSSGDLINDILLKNSATTKDEIWKNFLNLLNNAYENSKVSRLWVSTGIYAGLYAGMLLLLGFMLFLMTRGKNNMFNFMTFNDCQKIVNWSCLSPALLSLILGFLIPNYAPMMFIMLAGLRCIWLSTKQLRPQY